VSAAHRELRVGAPRHLNLTAGNGGHQGDPASVGLVHDYLLVLRGAERTFAQIAACWPQAPIYTLLYDEAGTKCQFAGRIAATSYLQRLPIRQRGFRMLLPVLPRAAERLPLDHHGVVISSTSAFGHGVRPPGPALHISYCHSPFRYIWHERDRALKEMPAPLRPLGAELLDRIRAWDVRAAARVDHFIANSEITRERIARVWGRDSVVIHPPVDTARFSIGQPEDYFLFVGELVPHKRVDAALAAARRAGRPMKVVGDGPALASLRARFGDRAEFAGRVDDRRLAELMSHARALVVPNVEEFGIAAVEAQAAGRPVIGPDRGGTQETVVDGLTGVLYPAGDFDSLSQAMREVDFDRFDPQTIAGHASQFSQEAFRARLLAEVARMTERAGLTVGKAGRMTGDAGDAE
jgi:glycosyltransferase involved in cell wall biosynthesis